MTVAEWLKAHLHIPHEDCEFWITNDDTKPEVIRDTTAHPCICVGSRWLHGRFPVTFAMAKIEGRMDEWFWHEGETIHPAEEHP